MSTPSTAAPVHPVHGGFYSHNRHYTDYQPSLSDYRASHNSHNSLRLPYSNNSTANASPDLRNHTTAAATFPSKQNSHHESLADSKLDTPSMAPKQRSNTNWSDFYKNGVPKEIIVIDDDTPEPNSKQDTIAGAQAPDRLTQSNTTMRHPDKRRKLDPTITQKPPRVNHQQSKNTSVTDDSTSNPTSSRGRSTAALQSTAPTSLASTSSSGQRTQRLDTTQVGQKRKRPPGKSDDSESDGEAINQNNAWESYIPPPKPPIKSKEVQVRCEKDKLGLSASKCDDTDGHYVVNADTELTERYTIIKLLGQGTFGKVVQAYDKEKGTECAIKIIRAVPKYRDASRIELRVLNTLACNDRSNRNRCIHLRECFDFRNHICIVTDLLSESVFDFLKKNQFVPFPSTHIQSFARQLFTSVAFLHDLNLIHTDLKPENILLVRNAYQTFTYNRTIPSSSKGTARQAKQRRVLFDPEIRLIDFGSATFDDEYHSSVVSTRHYRAPEIILNLGWSFPCDIWSIGCILVEFFTGDALFQTHDNLEHLAMMEAVCNAKMDRELIEKVRAGNRGSSRNTAAAFFKPRAFALNYPNDETPKASKKYVKNMKRLDETIPRNTTFNAQFLDLLQRIFVYDPRKRITAKQALSHPWFKEKLQDDGTEACRIKINKDRAAAAAAAAAANHP